MGGDCRVSRGQRKLGSLTVASVCTKSRGWTLGREKKIGQSVNIAPCR